MNESEGRERTMAPLRDTATQSVYQAPQWNSYCLQIFNIGHLPSVTLCDILSCNSPANVVQLKFIDYICWRISGRQWLVKVNHRFVYIFSQQINMSRIFFSSGIFTLQSKNTEKLSPNCAQLFVCYKYSFYYWWHCSSPVCQQKIFWRATVLQLEQIVQFK